MGIMFTPKQKVRVLVLLFVHDGFHGSSLVNAQVDVRLPQTSKSVSGSCKLSEAFSSRR